jgi:Ca2+:H+ antiporter
MPRWSIALPVLAAGFLAVAALVPLRPIVATVCGATLVGAVIAGVHHAEVVAHRVGEPFGTVVLAIAITVIELALIVAVMLSAGRGPSALPRDTVFSAIMIICNGVVGICLLLGGLRHHEQSFRIEGANSGLAALATLATLSLVLPGFTTSAPGPVYTRPQLALAAFASLAVWAVFVFVQTVRHREYFLPEEGDDAHAATPTRPQAIASFVLMIVALAAVVGLAKLLSPMVERIVAAAGAPPAIVGVVIAMLVLLPEMIAAARAAWANRLQTSLNLAIGAALASIGLTIPAVALVAVWLEIPLVLGLDGKDIVMLALTFVVSAFTMVSGRTTVMQGAVHFVIFVAWIFLAFVP